MKKKHSFNWNNCTKHPDFTSAITTYTYYDKTNIWHTSISPSDDNDIIFCDIRNNIVIHVTKYMYNVMHLVIICINISHPVCRLHINTGENDTYCHSQFFVCNNFDKNNFFYSGLIGLFVYLKIGAI